MKKSSAIFLFAVLSMLFFLSCKKSSPSTTKDYTAVIKDKTWTGEFSYTGKTTEYYAVHFNADFTMLWSQFSGDYTGNWALKGIQVTMTFDGTGDEIKANISDDNNLVNITDKSAAFEINSGELMVSTGTALDNTTWNGTTYFPSTKLFQLEFKPGLQATVNLENSPVKTYPYKQYSSNAVIRISPILFGVIISGSKMKGSVNNSLMTWQIIKQ
jgi:hypothetical protein